MGQHTHGQSRLRILATSDVHMHVLDFDYFSETTTPGIGLSQLATTITELRASAAAETPAREVLLLDNGDLLQGTALGDFLAHQCARDASHPLAGVMNALGYAAQGVGNHDLDYGLDYLAWYARDLDAPVLSSNLELDPQPPWLLPSTMIGAGGLKVGIVSALPPRTTLALHALLGPGARVHDMVDTVVATAQKLRSQGADLIVALAHCGFGPDPVDDRLEAIAACGAIDALIGGHTHQVFPGGMSFGDVVDAAQDKTFGTLHGVPTVMPGHKAMLVGSIDLDLEHQDDSGWTVTRASACVLPAKQKPASHSAPFELVRPAHSATCTALDHAICETDQPLVSYFSMVAPSAILSLSAAAQAHAIQQARAGSPFAELPILSAVSPPRAGGQNDCWDYTEISSGPIRERHVAEFHVYPNLVWAVKMSGHEIKDWLEKAASVFEIQTAGAPKGLLNDMFAPFDFDVIYGLTYTIDPTQPAKFDRAGALINPSATRVHDLCFLGKPLDFNADFLVAVNSFRACGGGRFPGLAPDRPVLRPTVSAGDAIRTYLQTQTRKDAPPPWYFAKSAHGVSSWFDTGPGALPYLDQIAHMTPGPPQLQPSGFVRIPITL